MYRQRLTTLPVIFDTSVADRERYAQVLFALERFSCDWIYCCKAWKPCPCTTDWWSVCYCTRKRAVNCLLIFSVMVVVDGKPVRLQLCDMAGQVSCTFSFFGSDHYYKHITQDLTYRDMWRLYNRCIHCRFHWWKSDQSDLSLRISFSSCTVMIEMGASWRINQCKSSVINND